jgi:hypothetical protein
VRHVWHAALRGARAQDARSALCALRVRVRDCAAPVRVRARTRDELARVLVRRLQLVDQFRARAVARLRRGRVFELERACALGTRRAGRCLLLLQRACVVFLALDVQRDQRRVLRAELSDRGLRLSFVDVVDEVEGYIFVSDAVNAGRGSGALISSTFSR